MTLAAPARPSLRHVPPALGPLPTSTTVGVLHPDEHARHVRLDRPPVDPALATWVENYWTVRWDLPQGTTFRSEVLSHPAVHLTVEEGTVPRGGVPSPAGLVNGVVTGRFVLDLVGSGRVFGVKFRPGGFGAFTGTDVATLTDAVVDWRVPMGGADSDLVATVLAASHDPDDLARAAAVDRWLMACRPDHDPRYLAVLDVVRDLLEDSTLVSVDQVCARHGLSVRTLQRLFRRYVGVGPKWLVQRYRLHDALAALDAGEVPSGGLADLAARLGWHDQAHFTREFAALTGRAPSEYQRRSGQSA